MTLASTCKVSRKMPLCCRKCVEGSKSRILGDYHVIVQEKFMQIHNLLQHLRTTEGIIRERFDLCDNDWEKAHKKYGPLKVEGSQ